MKQRVDYIIVGQGLAGSSLAVQLLKRDKKIIVFDLQKENRSSAIAAGIFNPITGKNWVKTWKADILFPYMNSFFKELERRFNKPIIHELPIYRPFRKLAEQNDWVAKSEAPIYVDYVSQVFTTVQNKNVVINPYGGLLLKNAGYVDIKIFLALVKDWLSEVDSLKSEYFDERLISHKDNEVTYKNFVAKKIIFCNGTGITKTSIWYYLPFRNVKGEVLTLQSNSSLDIIINMGVYLLPIKAGNFIAGSTYDFNKIDNQPTEKGKKQIIQKLRNFFLPKFDVIRHDAGIRPATLDRRPFLGIHVDFKNIVIFNGLGAKGVTLAPYYSEVLVNFLENNIELEKEVSIERFSR